MLTYEQRLNADPRWALSEGSRHFEQGSAVQDTLRRIAERLASINVAYAVSGGMALFHHGLRRFTEDVDILVTREGLTKIHAALAGLGYLPTSPGGKNLRDTQTGVRIDFLIAGDYPGDGKPKPVAFPDPGAAAPAIAVESDGVRYLDLTTLIELKLASGMTNPGRSKVTQDKSTPKEEPQASLDAEQRTPRELPFGQVEHPLLRPWMLNLVEKYFLLNKKDHR